MSKLQELKKWCSLEDAAKELSITFREDVTIKDVLRFCCDERLQLSILFINAWAIESRPWSLLANSPEYIQLGLHQLSKETGEICRTHSDNPHIALDDVATMIRADDFMKAKKIAVELHAKATLKAIAPTPPFRRNDPNTDLIRYIPNNRNMTGDENYFSSSLFPAPICTSSYCNCSPTNKSEYTQISGAYKILMTEKMRKLILTYYIILDSPPPYLHYSDNGWVVSGEDGSTYKPIRIPIEARFPPYLLTSLPPIKWLIIQTKHLQEFEESVLGDVQKDKEAPSKSHSNIPPKKKRFKFVPKIRVRGELNLLIKEMVEEKGVKYRDQLEASTAWGLIVSGKYKSQENLTREATDKQIKLNGGTPVDWALFKRRYEGHFEAVTD